MNEQSSQEPKPVKLKLSDNLPEQPVRSESKESLTSSGEVFADPSQAMAEAAASPADSPKKKVPFGSILIILFLFFLLLVGAVVIFKHTLSNKEVKVAESESTIGQENQEQVGLVTKAGKILSMTWLKFLIPNSSNNINTASEPFEEMTFLKESENNVSRSVKESSLKKKRQQIESFLAYIRVDGVRNGKQIRVILNGKNYQVGDIVDPTTGLRFIHITAKTLEFENPQGVIYRKSF